jgi:hypothetical protein
MAASPTTLAREGHDHRHGTCDLPGKPGPDWWRPATRCSWQPGSLLVEEGYGCTCHLCADTSGRRARTQRRCRIATMAVRRLRRRGEDLDVLADDLEGELLGRW